MNSFYSVAELKELGLKSCGTNVLISRKISMYSPEKISIGNEVRIDDFCILSGNITIGSHIHISAYSALYGLHGIELEDYTGLSPRCTLFSAMDDFSGDYLIGPIHPASFTNVTGGPVLIRKFAQIGSGSTIFPGVVVGEGCVVGAMSLVVCSLAEWGVYVGIPVRRIKERGRALLKFVRDE
ncbi:MAG: acyltransferase [Alistipes sp.]